MPRVEGVDVSVYVVPLEEPESDGTFTWKETTVVVAEPFGGGARGLGFSYANAACAPFIRDLLAPIVTGREILDVPGSWRKMVEAIRNVGRPGVTSMAIAAVDIGLWDLKAKLLDLPLCRLLGMCHDRVAIYGSGGFTSLTAEQLTGQVDGWVNGEGIPRVKMKIGTEHGTAQHRDLQRVELVRQTIGDDAELYVDANGGYTRKQAVRLAASFREMGVTWFEEPVSSDDLVGLHEVRSLIDLDVAAGEYGYDLAYFGRMCSAGAVDVLQADVSRCAGITEWLRAATVAAAHGLQISAHCAPQLHLHPACAVPNIRHLEYFADHVRVDHLLFDGVIEQTQGTLEPDLSRAGLGLELKRADAEPFLKHG